MTEPLATGIEVLDRKLDGGIPTGRVVAFSAAPASQSELFLYEVASVRETVYLTTERSETAVRRALQETGTNPDGVGIYRIDDEDPLADATRVIRGIPERSTVIVDPIRLLEKRPEPAYREFLNELGSRTADTGSVAFLHCLDGRQVPGSRDLTEYAADIVFDLATKTRGDSVENNLTVPKFRGGRALEEAISLDLTADVSIDISRRIA